MRQRTWPWCHVWLVLLLVTAAVCMPLGDSPKDPVSSDSPPQDAYSSQSYSESDLVAEDLPQQLELLQPNSLTAWESFLLDHPADALPDGLSDFGAVHAESEASRELMASIRAENVLVHHQLKQFLLYPHWALPKGSNHLGGVFERIGSDSEEWLIHTYTDGLISKEIGAPVPNEFTRRHGLTMTGSLRTGLLCYMATLYMSILERAARELLEVVREVEPATVLIWSEHWRQSHQVSSPELSLVTARFEAVLAKIHEAPSSVRALISMLFPLDLMDTFDDLFPGMPVLHDAYIKVMIWNEAMLRHSDYVRCVQKISFAEISNPLREKAEATPVAPTNLMRLKAEMDKATKLHTVPPEAAMTFEPIKFAASQSNPKLRAFTTRPSIHDRLPNPYNLEATASAQAAPKGSLLRPPLLTTARSLLGGKPLL
ncbi:hypothetical protein CXG81DRAFT_19590 [Caulochytrium protostelioides]|uniref:Secreted protein n=1 Tax=Caulochytrium protostelioides TaxID=1555241 RepID=A0A4P9X603_9FUNG|nr:hypothetical protein CXG81DRAFT_19590 [Caulochytrium protostelioides]|eukprot:RKP00440.1 hypothetical protein CXG81DRAFT_19590 [Caulochytrium protostelioides]